MDNELIESCNDAHDIAEKRYQKPYFSLIRKYEATVFYYRLVITVLLFLIAVLVLSKG